MSSELVAQKLRRMEHKTLGVVEAMLALVDEVETESSLTDPESGVSWSHQCAGCRKMRRLIWMFAAVVEEWNWADEDSPATSMARHQ